MIGIIGRFGIMFPCFKLRLGIMIQLNIGITIIGLMIQLNIWYYVCRFGIKIVHLVSRLHMLLQHYSAL